MVSSSIRKIGKDDLALMRALCHEKTGIYDVC